MGGLHTAAELWRGRPLCQSEIFDSAFIGADWQRNLTAFKLLIRDDLAHGVVDKVGDLGEDYNFSNWC